MKLSFATKIILVVFCSSFATRGADPPKPPHDVEGTCMNDNNIRQALFRQKRSERFLLFLETSNDFECAKMNTAHRCAMASAFGPEKNCAWCVSRTTADTKICVQMNNVDFYEQRDFDCAPHVTAAELARGEPGVRFGKNYKDSYPNEDHLIPRRRRSWGYLEFCGAAEAIYGGSFASYTSIPEVKKAIESVTFYDANVEEKQLTRDTVGTLLESIREAERPGPVFYKTCTWVFGEICKEECRGLARLYVEASRPGIETSGARTSFSQNWELNENDYLQSSMGRSMESEGGATLGGTYMLMKNFLGRREVPSLRPLTVREGALKAPGMMHTLKYMMSAKDCVRCLRDDVCMPDCLSPMTPCDAGMGSL